MPEITALGWFHTLIGVLALGSGLYTLCRYKLIRSSTKSGKLYLLCTLVAAGTALGIYNQGGFGVAHILAILTLLAVAVGGLAEKKSIVGSLSPHLQAASYSATFLFHMIPAITDGLMRLPPEDPIVARIDDPLLQGFYLAFLVTYVVGLTLQMLYLRRHSSTPTSTA
ncbi:MAG: hypothetical protein GKR90_09980 [Pseudomonadales bacterium]|nr:hypothetical protein [Pseudomonadales bacterium]